MRIMTVGFVLITATFAGTSSAQVGLAVENCNAKPGEAQQYGQSVRALVEYITANSEDLPGNPYGVFREVLGDPMVGPRVSFALEVEDLGEFEEFILARRDLNLADEQRNALFQEMRSHLDLTTCNWSFHLPIVRP